MEAILEKEMETPASKVRRKIAQQEKELQAMNTVVKVWEEIQNGKRLKKVQKKNGCVYTSYIGKV